jgi:hypothetical protein
VAFSAFGAGNDGEIRKDAFCIASKSQNAYTGKIGIRLPWYHQSKLASRPGSL